MGDEQVKLKGLVEKYANIIECNCEDFAYVVSATSTGHQTTCPIHIAATKELTMSPSYKDRKGELIEAVGELSGDMARDVLCVILGSIVTDSAGGDLNNPFAYMSTKDFRRVEKLIREYKDG